MTLATFAWAAAFLTFLGLGACTGAIVSLYRDTRDVRVADLAGVSLTYAVLAGIGAWFIQIGAQL